MSITDVRKFSDLLVRNRGDKTIAERALEIGVSQSTLTKWENPYGFFPKVEHLPRMCEVYGLTLQELTEALAVSKLARSEENIARKTPKRGHKGLSDMFPGEIANKSSLVHHNSQVNYFHLKR